ncbi:MAG TPA: diacylglycerol kinase family protein [Anaerolineales bacterium]
METDANPTNKKIFVILNPVGGHSNPDSIRRALDESCTSLGWSYEIYETTGKENVADITRAACQRGIDMVIAAGGDGTVAEVVNGMVNSPIPLGIIPVGTGNGLARALSIPLNPADAIKLLADGHQVMAIDAMQVGDKFYVLDVSAGISSRAMRDTSTEQKRRFGVVAYAWIILRQLLTFQPRRYNLIIDGHQVQVSAAEILVSNGVLLEKPPFPLGPREYFNDGQFNVYVLLARNLLDYLRLIGQFLINPKKRKAELRSLTVKQSISIDAVRRTQPVQADGELIGRTPVEVCIVPNAIQVIVPQ